MSPEDEHLVKTLRDEYTAPPMTGADVTRFDAQLTARRRKRAQVTWVGGFAAAAAAVVLAVGLSGSPAPEGVTPVENNVPWAEALTYEDLDVNPFAFLDLDSAVAAEDEAGAYAIETDWPAEFDGLSYLIEPMHKEI